MKKIYFLLILSLFAIVFKANAQFPGSLDSTFNGTGITTFDFGFQDNLTDVKVQPNDQKIVVVGTALTQSFSGKLLVARYLPNGTLDNSFNSTGYLIIDEYNESYAYECLIKEDGKILIAGTVYSPNFVASMLVMRLNEDGSIDTSFGIDGFAEPNFGAGDDFANAMIEQADHKIIICGSTLDESFNNAPSVVRLNEDGSIDTSFGTDGIATVPVTSIDNKFNSIVLQGDDKIVVSGHYDNGLTLGGQFDFDVLVARLNNDGTFDSSFGTNGIVTTPVSDELIDDVFGMKLTVDGEIVVSGFTTQPDFSFDAILIKYDDSGLLVPSFGTDGIVIFDNAVQDVSYDMVIQNDEKILITGTSGGFFFEDREFLLVRYNSDGTIDNSFGNDGIVLTSIFDRYDEANAITLQADGKIILAGKGNFDDIVTNNIAVTRHLNDVEVGINENNTNDINLTSFYPNPSLTNSKIELEYNSTKSGIATLEFYNLQGEKVIEINLGNHLIGENKKTIKIPGSISSGVYFLRLMGVNLASVSNKLIILD